MIRCAGRLLVGSLCFGILICGTVKAQERSSSKADAGRLITQLGHTGVIFSVAFSPSGGRLVLTASHDSTAALWDTATGWELRRFIGHTRSVTSAAFAPNGRTIVTASRDQTVRLWDAVTGQELHRFIGHTDVVNSAVFSPDGRFILSASDDRTARLWDVVTGRDLRHFTRDAGRVSSAVFARDGRTILIIDGDGSAHLWDTATGRELRRFTHDTLNVNSAVFAPDGHTIVTTDWQGAYLWNAATGQVLRRFKWHADAGSVESAIFAPDSRAIVIRNGQGDARLLDIETGKELRRFGEAQIGKANCAAFSPDGRTILFGSGDGDSRGIARLLEVETGKELHRFEGHAASVTSPVFSLDGRTILTLGSRGSVQLWDVNTLGEVRRFQLHTTFISSAVFSSDGHSILTGSWDGTARLWDAENGKELRRFQSLYPTPAYSAVFSPDSQFVLTICYPNDACLWDAKTGQELRHFKGDTRAGVFSAIFSPDGRMILARNGDGSALLWEKDTGQELRRFRHYVRHNLFSVTSAVFSPNGQFILTASDDGTARLWDMTTGRELHRFEGHTAPVTSAVFSPNGQFILTASDDGTARLWDMTTGRELHRFEGHMGPVKSAIFSPDPDGKVVLTAGSDHMLCRWDVKTGKELACLVSFTDGSWVIATPDGQFDTNNLEELKGLKWIMPDDPFQALPLEIFMRDYYEPQLLPRLLAEKKLPEIRSLAELNRAQPEVEIVEVNRELETEGHPADTVSVTVRVAGASKVFGLEGHERRMETGAYDLRLFRDGQLVGQEPPPGNQATTVGVSAADELQQWRQGRQVVQLRDGTRQIVFKGVRLPRRAGITNVQFSAYAFNEDRVKSETARRPFNIPTDLSPRRPRAYLVTVGVNAFEDDHWDLRYAVNDAKQLGDVLTKQLKAQRDAQGQPRYEGVVWVGLTAESKSENGQRHLTKVQANKAQIEAVFKTLAGQPVNADALQGIAHVEQLRRASPEDLVLLAFSTHGEVDNRGGFYLLPHDIGTKATEPQRRVRAISNDELSAWLQGLDVIDFVMIVDACHSAASVESEDFKPGPMGSRGLGQLAYDKRMRILAASQSQQSANETQETQMGLLSYALVREGLEENKADYKPKDQQIWLSEWLSYGVERVPKLDQDRGRKKGKVLVAPKTAQDKPMSQQPALFDFARHRDVVIGRTQ